MVGPVEMDDAPAPEPAVHADTAPSADRNEDRDPDARLARVHLRMGQLGLARAELEAMAGAATLDDEALVDLAEVRWRTGDLAGAGDAAAAYLDSVAGAAEGRQRDALTALTIAAESTGAAGRPGEARRLASRVIERADGTVDQLFAGMPRSGIWPGDPADSGRPAALFGATAAPAPARRRAVEPAPEPEPASSPTLWDADARPEPAADLDAGAEMTAAQVDLAAGQIDRAVVRLSLVLRVAPALAPAVLDLVGTATGPSVDLLRGDAYRLVGRETQAREAFTEAGRALGRAPAPEPPAPGQEWTGPDQQEMP